MDNNKIGKFITKIRKEKGLTQKELGEKLFVTDKAVSKWERGLSLPDITILEQLANILDVDIKEILQGKKGIKKSLNIEKELEKILTNLKQEQKRKRQKIFKYIFTILTIIIIFTIIFNFKIKNYYNEYHPNTINIGNNKYILGNGKYNLEKNGLDALADIMNKTTTPKDAKANITYLSLELNKKGNVKKFRANIEYFNQDEEWIGRGYYIYTPKNLSYSYQAKGEYNDINDYNIENSLVQNYSKSSHVEYISEKIKRIPLNKQITLSNLKHYVVSYNEKSSADTTRPTYDARDNKTIKALKYSEYENLPLIKAGSYFTIHLSENDSPTNKEIYTYVFDMVSGDIKNNGYNMECDYYINDNILKFTRDYGNTWITADISQEKIQETLNFHRSISFPPHSWTISPNDLIPIGFIYGENPILRLSTDNGETWQDINFELEATAYKDITKRIVRFADANFGYTAFGTDWTMGSGEIKEAFITLNQGTTWQKIELPLNYSRNTLIDFYMLDKNYGIVALNNPEENEFPLLYSTTNGGQTWQEITYNKPNDIAYLSTMENINKTKNGFEITLGQGNDGNIKAIFKTSDFKNLEYISSKRENIHTVG